MTSSPASLPDLPSLRQYVRTVPDFPSPGVGFRDITPLLQDARAFRALCDHYIDRYRDAGIELVAGIDARGFILGAVLAHALGAGFVPVRKAGKLPFESIGESYALEYGTSAIEMHTDAVRPGEKVLLVDDLIATGGTMLAAARLLQRLGADVVEAAAIIDLPGLGGSDKLRAAGFPVHAPLAY
ncbi:MAG TPA: adenine phosphoribosyltransferase [Rhodocyclaceae bacterium]|nr:adenine phosphoribosyltransferase [Rhodocyclaceae bacterium]